MNQADIGNHNPRVGGSSPSSATINQALTGERKSGFTNSVNRKPATFSDLALMPSFRRDLYLRYWKGDKPSVIALKQARKAMLGPAKPNSGGEACAAVYFIQAPNGPIKIGRAVNVANRLRALQTSHPSGLRLLAVALGGYRFERAYHRQFAEHRLHGEWFEPHPEILAEIDRLSTPTPEAMK